MRRRGGPDPGLAAIIGQKTIFFLQCVFGEIAAYYDEVQTTMELLMIFHGDGVCAGGCGSLEDRQDDGGIANKDPGDGAAADETGFIAVEVADISTAGGEAPFAGVRQRQFEEGYIMPGIAAVEATGDEEPALDGVADDNAAVIIPEFHRIHEHTGGGVLVNEFPGLSTVDSLEDIGGGIDGHDDGHFTVEGFDVAEITPLVPRDSHPYPGFAAVEGFPDCSAAAADPEDIVVNGAEPAEGAVGACGEQLDGRRGGWACGTVEEAASGLGDCWAITGFRIVAKTQQMRKALWPKGAGIFIMGK